MAIYKVITSPEGRSIGKATPQKLEDYLKYEENEQGEKIPRTDAITAINASSENFSEDCKWIGKVHGIKSNYDTLKYKHYVQGFPPEDCDKMTKEKCHALGIEAAKAFWGDFPVLVVTHYNQEVEGTGQYHWHNHFIVYNCNVHTGKRINTKASELWAQKRFIAAQAEVNGLTRKGLILENGRIKESQQEVRENMAERWVRKHGQKGSGRDTFLTQKTELRFAIVAARRNTNNYDDFCKYLYDVYSIRTKESRGSLGYLHPERSGQNRAWIRGRALGEAFTKEAIINGFEEQYHRSEHIRDDKIGYYEQLYREVFSRYPSTAGGNVAATGDISFDTRTDPIGEASLGRSYTEREVFAGDSRAQGSAVGEHTEGRNVSKTNGNNDRDDRETSTKPSKGIFGGGGTHI